MTNSYDEILQIKKQLCEKMNHPYLDKKIKVPEIDEERLMFSYSILKEANIPFEKLSQYVVTIMLVQLALDTHDNVTLSRSDDDDFTQKDRQLTVLAGDYFSGLYYYLLAQIEDIDMINQLAGSIKTINENKILIYHNKETKIDQVISSLRLIESLIIQDMADYVHHPEMKRLAGEFFLLKRLIKERKSFVNYGFSLFFNVLRNNAEKPFEQRTEYLIKLCDQYIVRTKSHIEEMLETQLTLNGTMQKNISQFLDNCIIGKEKVVEEG